MYHGSDLQMWFGIYGNKWLHLIRRAEDRNLTFMRQAWVRPSGSEVPPGAHLVEGATYW